MNGPLLDDGRPDVTMKVEKAAVPNWRTWFVVVVVMLAIAIAGLAVLTGIVLSVTSDTNTIVKDIEEQNSPAALRRQQETINSIIVTVDCNSRAALEDAINDLSIQHPEFIGRIDITDNCKEE